MLQAKKVKKEAERAKVASVEGDTEMTDTSVAPANEENVPVDAGDCHEPTDAELDGIEVCCQLSSTLCPVSLMCDSQMPTQCC